MEVGELEVEIAGVILVEGVGVVVGGAAVGLHDQAVLGPGEVDPVCDVVAVDARLWQACAFDQP